MSKVHAIFHVRRLMERGYTAENAEIETCMGASWPHGGYEIRKGRIEAPAFSGEVFSFRELSDEIEADKRQLLLF